MEEEAGGEEGEEQGRRLGGTVRGDGEVAAPPVVELSSSRSGEEGSSGDEDEEEESQGSVEEVTRGGGGNREARVLESQDGAEAERQSQSLPGCPICMNAWTADGVHRVSCIPCGHVYGRSCLERWLLQCRKKPATCPQCGRRFKQKDIINLYVPEIYVPYNDLEKQVLSLSEKNESLQKQNQELVQEIKEHKRHIILQQNFINESSLKRQNEIFLDGARVMGINASSQIIFTSGRAPGVGAEHVLTKVSMSRRGLQRIHLPPDTKAIRDMCILPEGHAVFASLGKKLSLFRLLAGPVQAIKLNGMLLTFDIRQTATPLHSMTGLSTHPVHTIHSVVDGSGFRKDPASGMLMGAETGDLLVASFRPKVELSDDGTSQAGKSQSPTPSASGKLGDHLLIRRTSNTSFTKDQICKGNVSGLRMSKSAIIPCTGSNPHQQNLFAYGDEALCGVRTWRLPSLQTFTDLRPHRQPILDLRFAESSTGERYLGCLSEDRLQVFRVR
uniref:RING-type domain-containing protein n=1 Tax=Leersia perrieri TaxID=77586 RepID=A0A0D9XM37_9ORYZ